MKKDRKRIDWKGELNAIVTANNTQSARNPKSMCSTATQEKRRSVLFSAFAELRALGYKIQSVRNFRTTHAKALIQHWIAEGQSPSTVQNKISILRVFCGWIGKWDMLPECIHLVEEGQKANVTRSHITGEDKSWDGKVDFEALVSEMAVEEPFVAMQLELQWHFGLRREESFKVHPSVDVEYGVLKVLRGAKGGKARVVPVRTEDQVDVLERASKLAGNGSMMPKEYTEKKWLSHYKWIMEKYGITRRKLGITSHGNRHGYAHRRFEELVGQPAPVKGGCEPDAPRDELLAKKRQLSEELGHSRTNIIGCYGGTPVKKLPRIPQAK